MNKKIYSVLLCTALVLAIVSCSCIVTFVVVKCSQEQEYTIYIGENDKDTGTPLHTGEEAVAIIDSVCEKYFPGYTLYRAMGRWVDDSDRLIRENTIVCYVTGVEPSVVEDAVSELLETMNQYSILVETKRSFSFNATSY